MGCYTGPASREVAGPWLAYGLIVDWRLVRVLVAPGLVALSLRWRVTPILGGDLRVSYFQDVGPAAGIGDVDVVSFFGEPSE